MYVSLFGNIWITDSPPIWERAADSVYHFSHLFTDVTSCCAFILLEHCGRSLESDCVHLFKCVRIHLYRSRDITFLPCW